MATGEHAPFIAYVDSKCSHFSVCQWRDSQHTDQCAQSERDSDANAPSDCYHCLASRPHRILVSPVKMCVRKPGQFVVGRQTGSYPETGFEEVGAEREVTASRLPQADFWPEIIWGLPVIRPETVPATPRIAVTPRSGFLDNGHRLIGKPRRRCRPEGAVPPGFEDHTVSSEPL